MEGWRNVLVVRSEWSGGVAECASREVGAERRASGWLFPTPWNVTEGERKALSDTLERNGGRAARLPLMPLPGGKSTAVRPIPTTANYWAGAQRPHLVLLLFCLVYDLFSVSGSLV